LLGKAELNQLTAIKEVRPDFKQVHSQVLQDVLKRVDKAFGGFFSRVKRGVKAGFPRFKGKFWYDSFTYRKAVGLSRTTS
jgi:putative transposase